MGLIWNETNGGHDIRVRGVMVHQLKASDITAALGTVAEKEASVVVAVNAKSELKDKAVNIALHIRSLSPLAYTLRCGPDREVLPDKWWELVADAKEVIIDGHI